VISGDFDQGRSQGSIIGVKTLHSMEIVIYLLGFLRKKIPQILASRQKKFQNTPLEKFLATPLATLIRIEFQTWGPLEIVKLNFHLQFY